MKHLIRRNLRHLRTVALACKTEAWFARRKAVQGLFPPPDSNVIVSLTSLPRRLGKLHLTIKSILSQTILPTKIVLFLNSDEMAGVKIPSRLKALQGDRFQIVFTEKNVRSYGKLFHALAMFPEKSIITIDDDMIYPPYLLQALLDGSARNPGKVICSIGRKIKAATPDEFEPYANWRDAKAEAGTAILPLGVYGVLYPPHSLDQDVMHDRLFMELAPTTDDLWFKIMAYRKGVTCKAIGLKKKAFKIIDRNEDQKLTLYSVNRTGGNDLAMKRITAHYSIRACDLAPV